MDRSEIRERARFLCHDELQYAIAGDDTIDTDAVRERATMRLVREMSEQDTYELTRGMIDGVFRGVERGYVVDFDSGQLGFRTAIKIADNTLVPTPKARLRDWLAFDEIRHLAFRAHAEKRKREQAQIAQIVERLSVQGEDATTLDVCPDLFGDAAA